MDGFPALLGEYLVAEDTAESGPRSALTQAVLNRSASGLLGLDPEDNIVLCNHAAATLLGVTAPDLWHPTPLTQFLDGSVVLDRAGRTALAALVREPGSGLADGIQLANGGRLHVAMGDSAAGYRFAVLELQGRAGLPPERTDALTGLADRAWFHARLATLLADPGSQQVAVLMIDLDRFKAVNDSLGHPVGDALLQVVAQRLRSAVRDGDVVSRLGGDEFAVVMRMPASAEATASRLVDLLSRPYLVEGHVAVIGASIGIALGPRDGADPAALLRAADLAMYQAKEGGRRSFRVFDPSMDERARARNALLNDLRRALALQQFELHFQPQTNAGTGKLVGFEALLRWRHPEHGLVPPDRFIPLAEETGLIAPIGEWVLRTACREASTWPGHLSVAVNVSPKQLADQDRLPNAVRAALAFGGLPAHRLEIEITESALVGNETGALQRLHALRAIGVRISMDDFGTGYSSLSQLRSFPFDKLKIDRSFVRDLADNSESIAVVRAIAALGASLGMTTTAEGVETHEQAAIIRADGCTDMQGYLVSRPVPAGDVAGLIQRLGASTAPFKESTT